MAFTYTTRSDGRLMKRVSINGKIETIYSDNPKDLERKYIEKKYKANNGLVSKNNLTFNDYANKWLDINSSGKSLATIKEYNYILNNYLLPNFGNYKLNKIKRLDIQELQASLISNNHLELAHKCIRFMKTILNDAIANDYLIKNPCFNIKEPKIIHKEKKVLTSEQDKLLLESQHKYANFFRILRYTGMRREEITALTIDDIDLKNRTISINKAVSFISNKPILKETKNKKTRTVPILDVIYNDLEKQVNYCKKNNIKYLFTKQTNKNAMLTQEAIRCMTNSFCNNIGFIFTPHQLRHSYCTMLYYSGISIKQTQKLMGHSSIDMVYNIYSHLDEQKESTFDKINNYISTTK